MSISNKTNRAINRLSRQNSGADKQFIVDNVGDGHVSPTGVIMNSVLALTAVVGFTASNGYLQSGSGVYPTAITAGTKLPAGLYNISVTSGSLLCTYK